jgi:alpha-L-fucosidase
MSYAPTFESVSQHPLPAWYDDAKLGIFIHWGLYSVPGWAPTTGTPWDVINKQGWAAWFAQNAYAEWYLNTLRIPGSATAQYHARTYGVDFPYDGFVPLFNQAIERWDPDRFAGFMQESGARYVVLTTKHHDGFTLWPSRHPNPFKPDYHAARDIVGELSAAVRAKGMRMGLYYSGGLDWTFTQEPITDIAALNGTIPETPEYVAYTDAHWRELIERYEPAVLWNDIGYPAAANINALFADYYGRIPDGVVNDRFVRANLQERPAGDPHCDFTTPEYQVYNQITPKKWESCRGIGFSFGYNRNEGPLQMISREELVCSLVDIVSKNGNLLLNIGPTADGSIPHIQYRRLAALGEWLAVNGEAIYGTRPWVVAEGATAEGLGVRFTRKGESLYATLLGTPAQNEVVLQGLRLTDQAEVHLLGNSQALSWLAHEGQLVVTLPRLSRAPAHTLKITPVPTWLG